MPGRYFDEWQVGDKVAHALTRTVTEADNVLICALTHNPQPMHLDHELAARSEFGKPLVNSVFTFGLMIGVSVADTTLGTLVANLIARKLQQHIRGGQVTVTVVDEGGQHVYQPGFMYIAMGSEVAENLVRPEWTLLDSEVRLEAGADPQTIYEALAGRLRVKKFEIVAPTLHNIFIEKVGGATVPALERVGDA